MTACWLKTKQIKKLNDLLSYFRFKTEAYRIFKTRPFQRWLTEDQRIEIENMMREIEELKQYFLRLDIWDFAEDRRNRQWLRRLIQRERRKKELEDLFSVHSRKHERTPVTAEELNRYGILD